jgi:Tfp pilus assembly protein PilX
MQDARHERRSGEQGFALILAILALMLLTFLGLTLATTTSTELQIATNYRWSQQALYNAEAGLDAARLILSNEADPTQGWAILMPAARPGSWPQGAAPGPVETAVGRDFERSTCDDKGGMGYGKVLLDATTRYENVGVFPTAGGDTLNGAFTIWIRRALVVANNGQYSDSTEPDELVIVSEGIAPYFGPGGAFTRSRQATRVLETRFNLAMGAAGDPCGIGKQQGQEGGSPMGENFNPCAPITGGAGGSLANAFGGAGAGGLAGTGVQ